VAVAAGPILSACGCSPLRDLTFCAIDVEGGTPIAGVHVEQIVPRLSAPWSWLLLPGGIGPDLQAQETDEHGRVCFENASHAWYRFHAEGYEKVEIRQSWLRTRWPERVPSEIAPDRDAAMFRVPMRRQSRRPQAMLQDRQALPDDQHSGVNTSGEPAEPQTRR